MAVGLNLRLLDHAELVGKGIDVGNGQIFLNRHIRRAAVHHTVLRYMGHADLTDMGNRLMGNLLALQEDLSVDGLHVSCDNRNQLALSVALNAGDSNDLALSYLHTDAGKLRHLELIHVL